MDPDQPVPSTASSTIVRPPHTGGNNIVVTAPSSPDTSPGRSRNESLHSLLTSQDLDHTSSHDPPFHSMNNLEVPEILHSKSHFELLLEAADMPEPGPAHFEARQKLWRVPIPRASTARPQHPVFERFLTRHDGRVDGDETWHSGVDKVWKGIMSGAKLRQNMPLSYLIQILQAGWIQDGTWPRGSVVPISDDEAELGSNDLSNAASCVASPLPLAHSGSEEAET